MLPERFFKSVPVKFVAADERLLLFLLLFVEDQQEVSQLWDGEGVPLRRKTLLVLFSTNGKKTFVFIH